MNMDSLGRIEIFLEVAKNQSFAKAAKLLGLPGVIVRVSSVRPAHVNSHEAGNYSAATPAGRMHAALRDWFVLATCPIWAGSLGSGFSRTAAAYSLSSHYLPSNDMTTRSFARRAAEASPWLHCGREFRTVGEYLTTAAGTL